MPHDKDSGANPAGPCAMVIFGAGGDLTKRLIIPALYNLTCAHLLPQELAIIGFDRIDQTTQQWADSLAKMTEEFANTGSDQAKFSQDAWQFLADRIIGLVRRGEKDPARLRDRVLSEANLRRAGGSPH